MSNDYVVAVEGLASLRDIENLPEEILRSARQAINSVTKSTRTDSARDMQQQVAFAARYLSGANGNLRITKQAQGTSLEARITGRKRPTSLARFATSRNVEASRRRGSVRVAVAPGRVKTMHGAFLMRLRRGEAELGNIGLAIRLKAGESVRNKRSMKKLSKGLYLLYGPSVDQVFRSVSADQEPKALEKLEAEFLRLMELSNA